MTTKGGRLLADLGLDRRSPVVKGGNPGVTDPTKPGIRKPRKIFATMPLVYFFQAVAVLRAIVTGKGIFSIDTNSMCLPNRTRGDSGRSRMERREIREYRASPSPGFRKLHPGYLLRPKYAKTGKMVQFWVRQRTVNRCF
jgi:hypothetical protein